MAIGVKFFRSTDASATFLTTAAGSLVAILDACLVNGYNSKTITITRSGSVATATATAHGFVSGQVIVVSGASQTEYNGEFYVVDVTANTFTYAVTGTPATPATGTITAKIAPAGWEIAFTGTNKRVYRAPSGAGNREYLRIDDSAANLARVNFYEAMTDVDTGTDPMPTAAQFAGGLYIYRSTSASNPWMITANNKLFHMFCWHQGQDSGDAYTFGDFKSYVGSDTYNTVIMARPSSSSSSFWWSQVNGTSGSAGLAGFYITRSYNGATKSINVGMMIDPTLMLLGVLNSASTSYPEYPTNKLYLSKRYILEPVTTGVIRGYIPGAWHTHQNIIQTNQFRSFDIWTPGSGSTLYGRKFLIGRLSTNCHFLEISDTWD